MSLTPNMGLTEPTVAITAGPTWAEQLNAALTLIDAHDHSPGYGVAITPAGININANLPFNDYSLTSIGAAVFSAQSAISDLQAVYVIGVDLYYRDGNNNEVRLTQSGSIVGTAGSITGLVSPASASYSASKFTFQSNVNTAANIDVASILLRNTTVSSYALTLNPPSGMGSNIAMTLPTLPASQKIMSMDSSGNMYSTTVADESTITWTSNTTRGVKNGGIGPDQIASGTLPTSQYVIYDTVGANTFVVPENTEWIEVEAQGGGGGGSGGGGGANLYYGAGGGGGAAGEYIRFPLRVTPGATLNLNIGDGGAGGAGGATGGGGTPGAGAVGSAGSSTTISDGTLTFTARGGNGGTATTPDQTGSIGGPGGTANSPIAPIYSYNAPGGTGGISRPGSGGGGSAGAGAAGSSTVTSSGGAGGTAGSNGGGGGGGGASVYGAGGAGGAGDSGAASAGVGAGSGGGGGGGSGSSVVAGAAGAAGKKGRVVIYYNAP